MLRSMLGLISSLRATVALQAALRWTARSGATRTVGTRARAAARGVPNGAAIAADVPCRLSTRVIEGRRPASRSWIHPGTGAHGDHHVSALPHHRPPPRAVPAAPPRRSCPAASPCQPPPLSLSCPHPSRRAHSCLAAMHQEDEDMEEGQTSIATPATEPAVEAPTGPTPTTDTAQGAAEDLG